ncbi:hypothetical protein [Acutalibacter sp. 1XD8-36]|uniref:hypothetical protein n=1 Tax=Acutalibacter sp. 1XD8-36 TaxID=2320852 RepID=UPI00261BAF4C|nr:hypothetical protein [Acutalibacter sp. 1XD8-36]
MDKKRPTINLGLKLVVCGIPLGLTLRLIQMNAFFDFETGFYTGIGEALAWLSLLLPTAMAVAAGVFFFRNSQAFTGRAQGFCQTPGLAKTPGPARGPAGFAGFSGGVLLVTGAYMLKDYMSYVSFGMNQFDSTPGGWMHLLMAVLSVAVGLLHILTALWMALGREPYKKAPLLYLPGVLWGLSLLVVVYVFHARFASTVENLFSVFSTVFLLMSLTALCRVLAGAGEREATGKLFVYGGLASVLVIPYDISNVALAVMGSTYYGELPAIYALSRLSVCLFVLSFMLSCYRTGVDKSLDGAQAKHSDG